MVIHLILTTLAGEEAQLTIELHSKAQFWSNFPK